MCLNNNIVITKKFKKKIQKTMNLKLKDIGNDLFYLTHYDFIDDNEKQLEEESIS